MTGNANAMARILPRLRHHGARSLGTLAVAVLMFAGFSLTAERFGSLSRG